MKIAQKIWLGVFLLTAVLPLLLGLGYALAYSFGWVGIVSEGFTLEHWMRFFKSAEWATSLGFSLGVAILSISLAVALASAFVLSYGQRLDRLGAIIYLPLAIPTVAAAFFSQRLLGNGGWLSSFSHQLGLIETVRDWPALINDRYAIGLILAHALLASGFFLLLMRNVYQSERLDELLRLAQSLGASPRRARWRIGLPVLLRRTWPTIILYLFFVLGSYEIPLLLGRQHPQMVAVLSVRYLRHYDLDLLPQAYILALVYASIVLSLTVALLRSKR